MRLGDFSPTKSYFISDTHFGHENIIKYCNRPFDNVDQMNTVMVKEWHTQIPKDADVFYLGDVAMKMNPNRLKEILQILPGKMYLIAGNHDKLILKRDDLRACFAAVCDIGEIVIDGQSVILCHYPLESWPGKHRKVLHLHGHSHGKARAVLNRLDVGVDATGGRWRPVSWAEVVDLQEGVNAAIEATQPAVASESEGDDL